VFDFGFSFSATWVKEGLLRQGSGVSATAGLLTVSETEVQSRNRTAVVTMGVMTVVMSKGM
jgi:hypothetical protein